MSRIKYTQDPIEESSIFGILALVNVYNFLNKGNILLKGHSTSVNCFGVFPCESNRVASGSYDTNIKLWDIR